MILHDSFNKISCFFLGFIYHLISIVAYLVFVVFRFTVNILLDKNKYRMMESGFESIMADNHGGTSPSNVIIIFKCTGTPSIEKIVDKLYQIVKFETTLVSGGCLKTPYQPFKKLGYAIVKKWGVSCWNIVHNFRAENHLVIDKVNRHLDVEIQERCERLLDTFHPNHQPQWEINILERYESKEYAFIWSIHHSYTDGTIFTQMVRHVLADEPFPIKIDPLQWNIKEAGFYSRIANVIKTLFFCTVGSGWFASMYGRGLGQAILAENDLNEKRGRSHCRSLTLDFNDLKTIQRNVTPPADPSGKSSNYAADKPPSDPSGKPPNGSPVEQKKTEGKDDKSKDKAKIAANGDKDVIKSLDELKDKTIKAIDGVKNNAPIEETPPVDEDFSKSVE
ncbi:hypothetical protein Bhyg_09103, partial [Pseudolycoriella hygida]